MRDLHGDDALFDQRPVVPAPGADARTLEVTEMKVPLSLIEGQTDFYIRYLMWIPAKPDYILLDGTDWGHVVELRKE